MPELFVVSSSLAFMGYGWHCCFSQKMREEFNRFELGSFRILTGTLELCGGLGLLIGLRFHTLLVFSASGLSILMFLGVLARIRVRDPLKDCLPALSLFAINLGIALAYYKKL